MTDPKRGFAADARGQVSPLEGVVLVAIVGAVLLVAIAAGWSL